MIQIGTGLFAAEVAAALTVCEGALFGRLAVVLATIQCVGGAPLHAVYTFRIVS
jgi:hypothetical protein